MDRPTEALFRAIAERTEAFVAALRDEGWEVESRLSNEDDGTIVFSIRVTLRAGEEMGT